MLLKKVLISIIKNKGFQAISLSILFIVFLTYFICNFCINETTYSLLIALSIFVGCIIYFRDHIERVIFNFRKGSLELELQKFEEDIVNALVINQRLLEISSGRWGGPPKKLKEIMETLGNQADKKAARYSKASEFADKVVSLYKQIDEQGNLKRSAPDHDERLKRVENINSELDKTFDDFIKYLINRKR